MKRIVVIGGGVAGLTAAVYARKWGYSAELCEKNAVVGGECTGWDREGFYIDNCIHWMCGTRPGTELNRLWRETGALDGTEVYQAEAMYTSSLGGRSVTLWKDIDRTQRELVAAAPEDEAAIRALMADCRRLRHCNIPAKLPPEQWGAGEAVKQLLASRNVLAVYRKYGQMDTQDLMNRFRSPLLRCMLSDFCTKESMGYSFPLAYGSFAGGDGGVPRGGSRAMALRMGDRVLALGGTIRTNSSAERILTENGRATGVRLADGTVLPADYVVCACDMSVVFRTLLDDSYMSPQIREMYENRAAYPVYGMFQAAWAVDSPEDAMGTEWMLESTGLRYGDFVSERVMVRNYAHEPGYAPAGKQVVQAMLGMNEAGYDYWRELYRDRAAYREKKAEIAGNIQRLIEERFPAYAGALRLLDTWTPMTYQRYCNAYKGYNQSFTITKASAKGAATPEPWIPGLSNVILCGQWMNMPGGVPSAAISGKFAIQRILRREGEG